MSDDVPMGSSRPYLIRALYEWIVDNGLTPYLLVDAAAEGVQVPEDFVKDGKIVLNLRPEAVQGLDLGNDWIVFNARFSGTPMDVVLPIPGVEAIYAQENGQGMAFAPESQESDPQPPAAPPPSGGEPHLKLVK